MFKLTFNKPAYQMFFEGENIKGVKLRVDQQGVSFLPVQEDAGHDIIPLGERGRGGLEGVVDGVDGAKLLSNLRNPKGTPHFMLVRGHEGWLNAIPFEGGDPPRFKPHVRVWVKDGPRVLPSHMMSHFQDMGIPQFVEQIKEARERIDAYNEQRKPGRPPKEVSDAQATLNLLSDLAHEFLPDFNKLRKAYEAMGEVLNRRSTPISHEAEDEQQVEVAQQAATPPAPRRRGPGRKNSEPLKDTDQPHSAHASRRKYRSRRA